MGQRRCSPHPLHMEFAQVGGQNGGPAQLGNQGESDSCDLGGPGTGPLPGTSVRA